MPSSSAPVDPEKLGHPVALTRGAEGGPAGQSANGSTTEAPRGVSFGAEETSASEEVTQENTTSTASGSISTFDFAQASSATEESHVAKETTQEKTTSTAGGLFSVPDFAQPADAKEEEVFSPGETGPSTTSSSVQEPSA